MELKTDKVIYHVETFEDFRDLMVELDKLGCVWASRISLLKSHVLNQIFTKYASDFYILVEQRIVSCGDKSFFMKDEYYKTLEIVKYVSSYSDRKRDDYENEINTQDNINSPKHYQGRLGLEVIEVHKNFMTENQLSGYYLGNTLKYLLRYQNKNGVEDLKKARKHLDWLIEVEEAT